MFAQSLRSLIRRRASPDTGPLRIGIIGAGTVVQNRHVPILQSLGGLRFQWVMDQNADIAKRVARRLGCPALTDIGRPTRRNRSDGHGHQMEHGTRADPDRCDDVDVVLIATPVGVRRAYWEQSLERGWNVFSEKPLATSLNRFDDLVQRVDDAGLIAAAGYARRYSKAASIIEHLHRLGQLESVDRITVSNCSVWSNTGQTGSWFVANPKLAGGGVLIETGSHLFDQLAHSLPVQLDRIEEFAMTRVKGYTETEAVGSAMIRYGERSLPMDFRFSVRQSALNGIFFHREDGCIHCGLDFAGPVVMRDRRNRLVSRIDPPVDAASGVDAATRQLWEDFLSAVRDRRDRQEASSMTVGDGALKTSTPQRYHFATGRFAVDTIDRCYRTDQLASMPYRDHVAVLGKYSVMSSPTPVTACA